MGNGVSAKASSTRQLTRRNSVPSGLHGEAVDASSEKYKCCIAEGIQFRNTPDPNDLDETAKVVAKNAVVVPKVRHGHWIQVADDQWLPMSEYWVKRDDTTQATGRQLLKKIDRPRLNTWDFMDAVVQEVKLNDALDVAADKLDRIVAVTRLQAAERGRQQRKKKRAARKAK